jgi:hypothetical protein
VTEVQRKFLLWWLIRFGPEGEYNLFTAKAEYRDHPNDRDHDDLYYGYMYKFMTEDTDLFNWKLKPETVRQLSECL